MRDVFDDADIDDDEERWTGDAASDSPPPLPQQHLFRLDEDEDYNDSDLLLIDEHKQQEYVLEEKHDSKQQERRLVEEEEGVEFEGHSHSHGSSPLHSHSHSHGSRRGKGKLNQAPTPPLRRPWWPTTQKGEKGDAIRLLVSHLLTRTGDKMWEFVLPLILSVITPTSLLPAALFGFVTTSARVILGTGIGDMVDKRDRLWVVFWGTIVQAISILCSAIALYLLLVESHGPQRAAITANIFGTGLTALQMILLLVSAVFGSLAAMAMDIAVERDWVPTIITNEQQLTVMNSRMRQVDLITEVGGPFIAGVLLYIGNLGALLIVATINFVSFLPEYLLLRTVYHNNEPLASKSSIREAAATELSSVVTDVEEDAVVSNNENDDGVGHIQGKPTTTLWAKITRAMEGEWNPVANLYRGWSVFAQQPTRLVVVSYALLWLTVLSPHDPLFTAYLKDAQATDFELGLFRGLGALFGVVSVFSFPWSVDRFGLKIASMLFIAEEGVFLVLSGLMFELSSSPTSIERYLFYLFVVLSRCGLYGFEIGEIQILQQTVPEDVRGKVSSVETSLTSLASLVFYMLGMILNSPKQFGYLVWSSVVFVNIGVVVFVVWNLNWDIHSEEHIHGDDYHQHVHDDPYHVHTADQERQMREHGGRHTHTHLHRKRFRLGFWSGQR